MSQIYFNPTRKMTGFEFSVDTETTGLDLKHGCSPYMVIGADNEANEYCWEWWVDTSSRKPQVNKKHLKEIRSAIYDADKIIMHNALFDIKALDNIGVWKYGIPFDRIEDTMLMSHAFDSSAKHGLKELAIVHLDYDDEDEELMQKVVVAARRQAKKLGWNIAQKDHPALPSTKGSPKEIWKYDTWIPKQIAEKENHPVDSPYWNVSATYGVGDSVRTMMLYTIFLNSLSQDQDWLNAYNWNKRQIEVIHQMHETGVTLKRKKVAKTKKVMKKNAHLYLLKSNLSGKVLQGESLSQPKVLRRVLFDNLKFEPKRFTPTQLPRTKIDDLIEFTNEAIENENDEQTNFLLPFLAHKKYEKSIDYIKQYLANQIDWVLYPSYNPIGTSTTRLNSSNPNTQNITKATNPFADEIKHPFFQNLNTNLRRIFGPIEKQVWLSIDYSQLQLRIFAYKSKEQSLINAFKNGWDAHDYMAHRIFNLPDHIKPTALQRRIAKNVNFGFIFGASPRKIEQTAKMTGLWNRLMKMFPNARDFLTTTAQRVKENGCVWLHSTIHPDEDEIFSYRLSCSKPHKGVNFIVQGYEGLIVKQAMWDIHKMIKARFWGDDPKHWCKMIMQVHDELNFSFDSIETAKVSSPKIKSAMENAGLRFGMVTPVDVDLITNSWDKSVPFTKDYYDY